ncbi:MAG: hypothetical protein JW703_03020 [Candidatus Diapherotrites archaeon]|nr:hypothetical protein [Candidatus Diapherotrites archaeon]
MKFDFLHPKDLVRKGYEKPELSLSVLFVLMPFLFLILIGFFYGFSFDLVMSLISLIKQLLLWVLGAVLLFVLIYILKGKQAEFNLKGILFNLSLVQLISFAMLFITFISLLIASPNIFSQLAEISQNAGTVAEATAMLSEVSFLSGDSNLLVFGLLIVIGIILTVYSLFILYFTISVTKKDWLAKNIIILIVYLWIYAMLTVFLPF